MAQQFKTFLAGDVLTADEVNNYLMKQTTIVCDSDADYPDSPVEGMVVYDKALDRGLLYDGSGWVAVWGTLPTASVERSTDEVATSGIWNIQDLDTEEWDTDNFHDAVTDTSRLTIPTGLGGKYLATATATFDASTSGRRGVSIYVNGTGSGNAILLAPSGSGSTSMRVTGIVDVSAADYVECAAFQDSGSNLDVTKAGLQLTRLSS